MERVEPPASGGGCGAGPPRVVRALVADFMLEALKDTGSRLASESCAAVEILHCPMGGDRWQWEVERQFDLGPLSKVDLVGLLGAWVPPFVDRGHLLELTDRVLAAEDLIQWHDVFPSVWANLRQDQSVYALPADGDVITMMYNEAMLREAGVEAPPATWEEWVAVSKLFHGRVVGGQAVAGSCMVTAKDDLLPSAFFAFAAPFLQTSGPSQGVFFDPVTLAPKFDNEAFRHALLLYREAVEHSMHNLTGEALTYTTSAEHFVAKRCPLYFNFIGPAKLVVASQDEAPRPEDPLRMALLPGTRHALEGASGKLAPCDGKVCPFAENGVNRAPFFAKGGISFAVNNLSSPEEQDLAFQLAAMIMAPQESLHHVLRRESMMDPFRYSHFEGIVAPDSPVSREYQARGWKHEQLLETAGVLQAAFEHENGAKDLSISFTMDYLGDKFDGILHNFLERRAGVDETVADLTTMWERLTNDIGRNAQTNVYRRSLGLPPLSPDIPVQHLHRALWLALALLVALVCLVARNLALTRDLQVLEQENKDAAEEVEREREVREVMESVPMEKVLHVLRDLHRGGKPPSKQELAQLLRLLKRGGNLWEPKLDRARSRAGRSVQFLDTLPQERLYREAYLRSAMPPLLVRSGGKRRNSSAVPRSSKDSLGSREDSEGSRGPEVLGRFLSIPSGSGRRRGEGSSSLKETSSSLEDASATGMEPLPSVPSSLSPGLEQLRKSMLVGSKRPEGPLEPPVYDPAALPAFGGWNWDPFSPALKGHGLYVATRAALEVSDVLDRLEVDREKLWRFIARIEFGMSHNAYHNKVHVSDVVSSLSYILNAGGLAETLSLSALEIFSAIIAACVHDFEHPGVTNDFLIKTQDPIALVYCDASVNEHYHLARAFQVMTEEDSMHFWAAWDSQDWFAFRKLVMDMVLATDMAKHFEILSKVKAQGDSSDLGAPECLSSGDLRTSSRESTQGPEQCLDRRLCLVLAIKAADVSAQCKAWKTARRFTENYIEEVFHQGDLEREQGLGISPLCDRENTEVAPSQVGFIDAIVKPLYEALAQLCPEMEFCLKNLEFSRASWRREASPRGPRPVNPTKL